MKGYSGWFKDKIETNLLGPETTMSKVGELRDRHVDSMSLDLASGYLAKTILTACFLIELSLMDSLSPTRVC